MTDNQHKWLQAMWSRVRRQVRRARWRLARYIYPSSSCTIAGFDRIGRIDRDGLRSLWMRIHDDGSLELRAGLRGRVKAVLPADDPRLESIGLVMLAAQRAALGETRSLGIKAPDMCQDAEYEDAEQT